MGDALNTEVQTAVDSINEEEPIRLTLLLLNSEKVPITIDNAYLQQHDTTTAPDQLTVLQFKQTLWQDWQETWGNKPANPNNIRLIHLGKVLDATHTLSSYGITRDSKHNVVHCSVIPESFELDQESQKVERGAKCCIIL